ncbi:MAG: hypothetical protein KF744_08545 [Taibaiella sp.]|nr:hypothetical protein [Taibaiella sp.]
MKGFIEIKNAQAEADTNTYYVNTSAIVYFYAIEMDIVAEAENGNDENRFPKTFVVVNANDFDGTQLMFKIADSTDVFAARLEAAMV